MFLYTSIIVLLLIVTVYIICVNRKEKYNIMEDMPKLNIEKDELERHAEEISSFYSESRRITYGKKLMKSLDESYRRILEDYYYLDEDSKNKIDIVPAGEWLLDNLYLIEKEYKDIKENMPKKYYRDLPVVKRGIMKGYPRIYYIAVEIVSHTDGKIDEKITDKFIEKYQERTILTSGELWALPIMLRIALIQNISTITNKILISQKEGKKADKVSDKLIEAVNNNNVEETIKELVNKKIKFTSQFTEKLLTILRDNSIEDINIYKWIDRELDIKETDVDKVINQEHKNQSIFQVSIGNYINSIRSIQAFNWKKNFEKLSYVEKILSQDPIKIYSKMDFESRDYYRHKLEKLSKIMNIPESFIAKKAIECAKEAEIKNNETYVKHVGYYIIDKGIDCLKEKVGFKTNSFSNLVKNINKNKVNYYIVSIIIVTLILMAGTIFYSININNNLVLWKYIIAAIVIFIPCSEIVISIFNWSINRMTEPRFIPKIEYYKEIPEEYSSMIVISTLINDENNIYNLIEDLEVYYLANPQKNIYYGILGDFKDSKTKDMENDNNIINIALEGIKKLNKKYSDNGEDIFYFFNRYRQYNEKEKVWIGWERKRGKLMEFNALIRGDKNTSYNVISGDISNLNKIKYIITLDADTQLPKDSAKKLIGAMSHILNLPYIDKENKKVLRGYGLLQPRISVSNLSANKTLFSKIFSGEVGLDTYTTAVSDVYQDLFGEGIFTGKGIYDVDIFNNMLKNEIPENSVLSHDLLEGSYVKAGLVTDIELIDGYPAYYNSSCKRLHRWVRGDWQLIPWISKKNTLNTLSKWKIIDNMRRSLLAPFLILLLILSVTILPNTDIWLTLAFISILAPILFDVSDVVVLPQKGIGLSGRINSWKTNIKQLFLIFCFLPHKAYLMLDAIFRTIYRLYKSKKNLLQWQTAADAEITSGKHLKDYIKFMWVSIFISVVIMILAINKSINTALVILPSCILWFISPFIAFYIGKNLYTHQYIKEEDRLMLRQLTRKTWAYFEDFVNDNTNWLAPDNYQEYPDNGIAHRTSPTNMGMGITSNVVAYDFGYIGILELIDRLEKSIDSMENLEKYKGHFYNWYDTNTKKPLYPRYVSTVDSGNLVGYLWVVSETLREVIKKPIFNKKEGLIDLLYIANKHISIELGKTNIYSSLIYRIDNVQLNPLNLKMSLEDILSKANKIDNEKSIYWNKKVIYTCEKFLKELNNILPWIEVIDEVPKEFKDKILEFNANFFNMSIESVSSGIESFIEEVSKNKDDCILKLKSKLLVGKDKIEECIDKINKLINKIDTIAYNTDFTIVYDDNRQLFSIGYDIENEFLTKSYYDLFASESRQASFVAIAKGDIEQNHWFNLGRSITKTKDSKVLMSWSGTMFEYFMPLLIMKNYKDTLWDETYKGVIREQKRYAKGKNIPWGISESAFYDFDLNSNYQYKAFGVPAIGLKRGLVNETVISPYSTILAMQIDLEGGIENIKNLMEKGFEGKYGFFESIDYTIERVPKGKKEAIIKNYMVHHEGMSLMALDNVLNNNILQNRFHNIPKVKAIELLLQEKIPDVIVYNRENKIQKGTTKDEKYNIIVRKYISAKTNIPEVELLSNGNYSLMISNRGTGYSKKDKLNIYRWKENVTNDNKGMFFYIKNLNSNEYWSNTYEPCKTEGDKYEVTFSLDRAEFQRKDGNLITNTEVIVTSDDDAEIRNISITNTSNHTRTIEVTSYCEVTLATYSGDLVHPAFSNLFINTEYVENPFCIIANRRPRSDKDINIWLMQTVTTDGESLGRIEYETSRENFIGRCRDLSNPKVMENEAPLKNTVGAVLDPIISIRVRLNINPGKTCKVAYTIGVANSKEEVIELANKYNKKANIVRAFELVTTATKLNMKYLGMKSAQANLCQLMASKILYLNNSFKNREEFIKNIKLNQQDLWAYGVSGDLPIVLLIIDELDNIHILRQLLKAHEYWSVKGLEVDLVIINLNNEGYVQNIQDSIRDLIYTSHARDKVGKNAGVFLINNLSKNDEHVRLFIAISKLVFYSSKGTLLSQLSLNDTNVIKKSLLNKKNINYTVNSSNILVPKLEYFNSFGGFDLKSNSYIIILENYKNTPAPWINVISNGNFGFHVSENGVSYTWNKNSRENKLTTWSNDPISDDEAEEIYIRDEDTGDIWSISPKPIRDSGKYIIEHGFGFSSFKHQAKGILGQMDMFVPIKENTKLCFIKLKNNSNKERSLSITYYARLVMGVIPENTSQYISTYINKEKLYIYAKNLYNKPFKELITYLSCSGCIDESFTCNRKDFIGIGGSINYPEALKYENLSNECGAGYDPCLALNGKIKIKPNEEKCVVFILGQEKNQDTIENIINKYKNINNVINELENIKQYWNELLTTIQVKTPDKSMDIMVNGWLMYQVISCRFWARTAFYQSGGAYGFRDQLQDSIPITYLDSNITRNHILYSASRQFKEGDVQHWWHPVIESGIRTRFSDDLLWLPYTVISYINITGDYSILDEKVNYIEDEPLKQGEDERYTISKVSKESDSIYEHCIKAIERAAKFGEHNIPLMGSGDWNDGMSTVGNKGKGESVWLGWFLYTILDDFYKICIKKQEKNRANNYKKLKEFIKDNIEKNAWDGGWYRRAYFDDGTPLGSIENEECQIDSLSQSWAVISNAAKKSRQEIAMKALEKYLVKENRGMVMLLNPAFNNSKLEPGYIKGYVPGVRENGGQYTHAAIWTIIAFAKLGYKDKAWSIFNMINPINHTKSYLECETYKIEPYVMSADVYAREPHQGRGGWSWYTGSAGWMYRAAVEYILGFKIVENKGFKIEPCIPDNWKEYSIYYKNKNVKYNIKIIKNDSKYIEIDGNRFDGDVIPFEDGEHNIKVFI